MLRIGTVVMRVGDLARAIAFWTQALDYVPEGIAAEGDGARLALDVSASPAPEQPSVHLDLYAGDALDQAREVERLVSLGASRVDWAWYLADPEGNRFCVIDTSHGTPGAVTPPA